jgi:hypothetical protein
MTKYESSGSEDEEETKNDINLVKEEISDEELLDEIKYESDDDEDEDDEHETSDAGDAVSGWADSMAKILGSNKPKNKKSLILSRAKLDHEIQIPKPREVKKRPVPSKTELEIVGAKEDPDNQKKPKLEDKEKELSIKQERKKELHLKRENKEWENINRIKPTRNDSREKEIDLLKIATKGVVQLFNAVNLQQKTIKSKLNDVRTSEFKKDKVLKKTKEIFEDALEKSSKLVIDKTQPAGESTGAGEIIEIKDEEDETSKVKLSIANSNANDGNGKGLKARSSNKKPSWQALHDDYMLDAKLKDWDRSDSDE